jgi:hypothetical protein
MATEFTSTLVSDVTTDAKFIAIVQFVEDTLVGGGWVVTGDTLQTLPSAMVHPTVANSKKGYRIYRMNDALQATAPVFVRFDFGSAPTLTVFAYWITIGTGSDGFGNITGIVHNGGARLQGVSTNNTGGAFTGNSYGSAAPNRFSISMFALPQGASYVQTFMLERSKDFSGNDTSDGLIFIWQDYATGSLPGPSHIKYLILAGGTQPNEDTGLNYNLSTNNPTETWIPGDVQAALPFPFKGVAQQPGMNMVIIAVNDCSAEGNFTINLYGRVVAYQQLNTVTVYKGLSGAIGVQDINGRVAIRYD